MRLIVDLYRNTHNSTKQTAPKFINPENQFSALNGSLYTLHMYISTWTYYGFRRHEQ